LSALLTLALGEAELLKLHFPSFFVGTMGHPIGWATVPANPPKGGIQVDQQIFLKEGSNKTNQQQRATLLFNLRYEGEFHRKVHWTHKIAPIHENELYN